MKRGNAPHVKNGGSVLRGAPFDYATLHSAQGARAAQSKDADNQRVK